VPDRAPPPPQPALPVAEARRLRRQLVHAAAWLQGVWGDEAVPPAFRWETLSGLPAWALGTRPQLERLALLTGTLFAAPALRRCLHPGPLLRVRGLLGSDTLERVLALPDDPTLHSPEWPADESSERDTLHAWGAALLAASLPDPLVQASLVRALSLSPVLVQRGLPPAELGLRMANQALEIAAAVSPPAGQSSPAPQSQETA